MNDVFGQFADALRELVPADGIYVKLMNEDETAYTDSYGWNDKGLDPPTIEYIPVSGNPMELLLNGRLAIPVNDDNIGDIGEN